MTDEAVALVRHELAALRRGERSGLKRLKPKHCEMIAAYCDGRRIKDIAEDHKTTAGYVQTVIRDPAARPIIDSLMGVMDAEFRGLYTHVIEAVRGALMCSDRDTQLKAVETWLKVHGKYKQDNQGGRPLTAEDVVQKLLESHRSGGPSEVSISVGSRQQYPAPERELRVVEDQSAWVEVGEDVSDPDIMEKF